jgi:light-harvesting complex II chlorophyll a/b binding protein 7
MLAVVGVVVPELLASFGALPVAEPVWWKVGAAKAAGADLAYLGLGGFVIAGKQGIAIIALCQAVLMGGPEYARFVGIRSLEPVGVYLPGDANYPGGAPFDPFGLSVGDAAFYETQRVAEIKHGRLAMVAMAGVFAQAAATGVGPVENLRDALERAFAS